MIQQNVQATYDLSRVRTSYMKGFRKTCWAMNCNIDVGCYLKPLDWQIQF